MRLRILTDAFEAPRGYYLIPTTEVGHSWHTLPPNYNTWPRNSVKACHYWRSQKLIPGSWSTQKKQRERRKFLSKSTTIKKAEHLRDKT